MDSYQLEFEINGEKFVNCYENLKEVILEIFDKKPLAPVLVYKSKRGSGLRKHWESILHDFKSFHQEEVPVCKITCHENGVKVHFYDPTYFNYNVTFIGFPFPIEVSEEPQTM